ncbi:MAG: hypothetical protein M3Q47_00100 [Actinomycetota bacterium]|nr:hypothetical protein [Actinomycetota bacterium]
MELEVVQRGLSMFVENSNGRRAGAGAARRRGGRGARAGHRGGYHWRWLDTVERAQELLAGRPPGW